MLRIWKYTFRILIKHVAEQQDRLSPIKRLPTHGAGRGRYRHLHLSMRSKVSNDRLTNTVRGSDLSAS